MTKEELDAGIAAIQKRSKQEIIDLQKEYALSNNTVKVGDSIKDKSGAIGIVRKIQVYRGGLGGTYPECCYVCDNITKKGTVNKLNPTITIFQSNIAE